MILRFIVILSLIFPQGPSEVLPKTKILQKTTVFGKSSGHSFGRSFNGTTDALNSSATVDLTSTPVISVWFWLNKTAFANDDHLAAESSTNHNSNNGAFIIDPDGSVGSPCSNFFAFGVHQGGLEEEAGFTRPSAGAWHSYLLVISTT